MSLQAARQQIVTAVEAVRATYGSPLVVNYNNRDGVDANKQHTSWLSVDIQFLDAYQGDLSDTPFHRHIGVIVLEAYAKEGQGVAKNLGILDHFSANLHGRQFGIVRTHFADMRPSSKSQGWYIDRVAVPFWFDVVVTIP